MCSAVFVGNSLPFSSLKAGEPQACSSRALHFAGQALASLCSPQRVVVCNFKWQSCKIKNKKKNTNAGICGIDVIAVFPAVNRSDNDKWC